MDYIPKSMEKLLPIAFSVDHVLLKSEGDRLIDRNWIFVGITKDGESLSQLAVNGLHLGNKWLADPEIFESLKRSVEEGYKVVALYKDENGKVKKGLIPESFFDSYEKVLNKVRALYLYNLTKDYDFVREKLNLNAEVANWLSEVGEEYSYFAPMAVRRIIDKYPGKIEVEKLNRLAIERQIGRELTSEEKKLFSKPLMTTFSQILVGKELKDYLPLFKMEGMYYTDNTLESATLGMSLWSSETGTTFVPRLKENAKIFDRFAEDYKTVKSIKEGIANDVYVVPDETYAFFEKLSKDYGLDKISAKAFGVEFNLEDLKISADLLPDDEVKTAIERGVFFKKGKVINPETGYYPPEKVDLRRLEDALYVFWEGLSRFPFVQLDGENFVLTRKQLDEIENALRERAYKVGREKEEKVVSGKGNPDENAENFKVLIEDLLVADYSPVKVFNPKDKESVVNVVLAVPVKMRKVSNVIGSPLGDYPLLEDTAAQFVYDLGGDLTHGFGYAFVQLPKDVYGEVLAGDYRDTFLSDGVLVGVMEDDGLFYYLKPEDREVVKTQVLKELEVRNDNDLDDDGLSP